MQSSLSPVLPSRGMNIGPIICAIAIWMGLPMGHAQTLMFDFGPTTPTGANLTNSPGHFATAIPGTDTTWNLIGTSDVLSGLLYGNGTAATGVSIATGHESTASSNSLSFTVNPGFSAALGSQVNSGIYIGDSVATDGIYHSNTAAYAVGVQIGGLAAGQYEIYISGRNTNVNGSYAQRFYASASGASTTFDFTSVPVFAVANSGTAWAEGTTYARFNVTLTEGDVLNLATEGTGTSAAGRGFLNSVQIVAVPEPSSMGLLGFGVLTLLLARKRTSSRISLEQ